MMVHQIIAPGYQIVRAIVDILEENDRLRTENEALKRGPLFSQDTEQKKGPGRPSYVSYREASQWARMNRISLRATWRERTKGVDWPTNIPKLPDRTYGRNGEWKGWRVFFGLDKATIAEKKKKTKQAVNEVFGKFVEMDSDNNKPLTEGVISR